MKHTCDKCDGENDIHESSNYCSKCRDEYQRRVAKQYETRPIDVRAA